MAKIRLPASLRLRLIAGAVSIALVATFAALVAVYGAAESNRQVAQSAEAQRRMDLLSTLSARISDFAVVAVEASAKEVPAEAREARLASRAALVDEAFARVSTALGEAVAEAEDRGEVEQMRRATRSLVVARMQAQFLALNRSVSGAQGRANLRAILDGFATQFSPLLNEAIAEERRDRDAAAANAARLRDRMLGIAFGTGVLALALVALFNLLLIRPLITRLGLVSHATDSIGRGSFDVALPTARSDELGHLFEAVNRMAAQLKERADAVARDQAQLNSTIAERTSALSEANERLSRIDAERRRFFADIGHELRTPLTVILAESELAMKPGTGADQTRQALSTIRARAMRLSRRIADLLRVASSETGQIELDANPFDLADAAADAVSDMAALAERRRVRIEERLEPAQALGDRDWCRQVVSGLIDNAIRHAPSGTRIKVATCRESGSALLTVTDEGEGLAPGDAERVFTRFARGGGEAAGTGFGVGLALARWVAEQQQGTIDLVSPAPRLSEREDGSTLPGVQVVMRLPEPDPLAAQAATPKVANE